MCVCEVVALPDGKYSLPASCPEPECRGKQFSPLRSSPNTHTIDWQTIRYKIVLSEVNSSRLSAGYSPVCRVQELASDGKREVGRIPRTIECELTSDLVDSCIPGDMVTITAVVKATGSDEGERSSSDRPCHLLPGDTPLLMNSPPHPPLPPLAPRAWSSRQRQVHVSALPSRHICGQQQGL